MAAEAITTRTITRGSQPSKGVLLGLLCWVLSTQPAAAATLTQTLVANRQALTVSCIVLFVLLVALVAWHLIASSRSTSRIRLVEGDSGRFPANTVEVKRSTSVPASVEEWQEQYKGGKAPSPLRPPEPPKKEKEAAPTQKEPEVSSVSPILPVAPQREEKKPNEVDLIPSGPPKEESPVKKESKPDAPPLLRPPPLAGSVPQGSTPTNPTPAAPPAPPSAGRSESWTDLLKKVAMDAEPPPAPPSVKPAAPKKPESNVTDAIPRPKASEAAPSFPAAKKEEDDPWRSLLKKVQAQDEAPAPLAPPPAKTATTPPQKAAETATPGPSTTGPEPKKPGTGKKKTLKTLEIPSKDMPRLKATPPGTADMSGADKSASPDDETPSTT